MEKLRAENNEMVKEQQVKRKLASMGKLRTMDNEKVREKKSGRQKAPQYQ